MKGLITTSSRAVNQIVEDMQRIRVEGQEKRNLVKKNWAKLKNQSISLID